MYLDFRDSRYIVSQVERTVGTDDGRVVIDLERVSEVHVRSIGGEVSVGGTPAPPRLEVECQRGDPIEIFEEDGVVVVEHRAHVRQARGWRSPSAVIALTVPPGTPVDV